MILWNIPHIYLINQVMNTGRHVKIEKSTNKVNRSLERDEKRNATAIPASIIFSDCCCGRYHWDNYYAGLFYRLSCFTMMGEKRWVLHFVSFVVDISFQLCDIVISGGGYRVRHWHASCWRKLMVAWETRVRGIYTIYLTCLADLFFWINQTPTYSSINWRASLQNFSVLRTSIQCTILVGIMNFVQW